MNRRPFSRREKLALGASVPALLLLGSFGWLLMQAKRSGAMPPHAPMPRPNGFDIYVAAATAMTRPSPPLDEDSDTKKRTPQEAAKIYTPARRAAWVAANAKAWVLMRQARAAQTEHPDIRANWLVKMPYAPLRELARGKRVEAAHFKDIGRWDLALESGLDSMEMGHDIEHGAPFIGSLVAIAIQTIGAYSLDDVPAHLSASQGRAGVRRLEKLIASGASPAEVLSEEKWVVITAARNNFGSAPRAVAKVFSSPLTASVGPMMDACIAQVGKPFALQVAPPAPTGILNSYAAILQPPYAKFGFHAARREAMESELLLRLLLRAYRVENGIYPDTLAALAPRYIAKIPRDPFGRGEALRYRKTGDSYLVWSIGPDGKDDGGQSIKLKPGKKRVVVTTTSRGDAVAKP